MTGQAPKSEIAYVDKLASRSLWAIVRSRKAFARIIFFDQTKNALVYAGLFRRLGLLKAEPEYVFFRLGDLQDERGGCLSNKISENVASLCASIEQKELAVSDALRRAAHRFDRDRLHLFFKKVIASEIYPQIINVHAIDWHSRENGLDGSRKTLFLTKSLWRQYVSDYALKRNVGLISYGLVGRSVYFRAKRAGIIGSLVRKAIKSGTAAPSLAAVQPQTITSNPQVITAGNPNGTPKIGALFAGRTVTFDTKRRSDFFWLLNSKIPPEQVLVYLHLSHSKATADMVDKLAERKMGLVALSADGRHAAGVPVWTYRIKIIDFLRLAAAPALRLWRQPKRSFYLAGLSYFISKYLYWSGFVEAHNIKVNFSPTDFIEANIPLQQAVADNGGVSASYHWSNIDFISMGMSNCADVLFSFGPAYKPIFEKSQAVIDNLVYCGYITDYSFKEVKEDALKLREQLRRRGAKFILCFFDENSDEGKTSVITHQKTTDTYRYFIERMLEDERLGLIFKPGYPTSIYQRIAAISDLIEKAKATGRCVFLDKGTHVSEKYPSEAAQAADLSVGLLFSGTVALESHLSGTPTVFLDLEKLYSNPIYKWGKGKVVFDNLDELFSAIGRYRQDPASIPGFGDLSRWAEDRDPFRDGQASLRIGQYLNWLLEKFNEGKTRQEAMAYANANYKKEWVIASDPLSVGSTGLDVKGALNGRI